MCAILSPEGPRDNTCQLRPTVFPHQKKKTFKTRDLQLPFCTLTSAWPRGGEGKQAAARCYFTPNSHLSAQRAQIAAIFAICDCDAHRGPPKSLAIAEKDKAVLHCNLRSRWKSLAVCDSELQFPSAKPIRSAGILTIWLRHHGNC